MMPNEKIWILAGFIPLKIVTDPKNSKILDKACVYLTYEENAFYGLCTPVVIKLLVECGVDFIAEFSGISMEIPSA